MTDNFERIKEMVTEVGLLIVEAIPSEEILIVSDEERGIANMIIDLEDPILIVEQLIMEAPAEANLLYRRLLQMNRELVHGAFVLDDTAKNVFFRDTLELHTLDVAELEGTINALSLALAENAGELLQLAGK